MPTVHELKIWPAFFEAVASGEKPFELRKDDRQCRVGDVLWLREWHPETRSYTGREVQRRVTYRLADAESFGLMRGFVILGLGSREEG